MNSSSSSSGTNSSSGGTGSTNPYLDAYNAWHNTTPIVTRFTMICIIILYLISWFINMDTAFNNSSYYTIYKFQIYRLFLSPFVGNSILSIVFLALFYPSMASRMENSMGSTFFVALLCIISIVTNVIFVVITTSLYYMGVNSLLWSCSGFWTIIFGILTIECLAQPDMPRRIFMLPIDIPSKYFPLAMLAFFYLFNGFQLDFFISVCIGAAYSRGLLDRLRPSSTTMQSWESQGGCLFQLSRASGWVLNQGHDEWIPVNTVDRDVEANSSGTNSSSGNNNSSSGFSGWGGSRSTSGGPGGKGEKEASPFPGSGRTLSSNTGSSIGTISSNSVSYLPSAPAITSSNREAIAARRLEKFKGTVADGTTKTESYNSNNPSSSAGNSHDNQPLQRLMDMGFNYQDSIRALEMTGGSFSDAVQILTN